MTSLIYPGPGEEQRVARALLDLADSPYDVQTTVDDGLAFVVPLDLAARFEASLRPTERQQPSRGRKSKESS